MDGVVGRDEDLRALRRFLDERRTGAAALVLEGEAGIGKTTLWVAAVAAARASLRVLTARPAPAERDLAYAGLGDLLEGVLDEFLPGLPEPRRRALEVALLLSEAGERPPDARAVGVALLGGLRSLAASGPVLVAIDDVHWLDTSSAAALEYALRRIVDEPILLLLTRRLGEPGPTLEQAMPPHGIERYEIAPLSLGAIHRLVRQRLGRSFPRPTLLRAYELSGGNPFFALELARALERAGVTPAPGEPFPVPDTLEALLRDRLEALPAESREILLASASAAEPTVTILERGWPDAARALALARDADVVSLDDERVRFTHPLLGSVLYENAAPKERRRVHGRLARLVEDPVEQARHLALAAEGPDPLVARRLDEAAGAARARGAPIVAAELGELAVRATPPGDPDHRTRRVLLAARDHLAAGEDDRVRALGRELLQHETAARFRAEALVLLSEVEEQAGQPNRELALLKEALREAAGIPKLMTVIHCRIGNVARFAEGTEVGVAHTRAAVELAERAGDDALLSRALATLAELMATGGELGAIAHAERAVALARRIGDPEATEFALWALGACSAWAGRVAEARNALVEAHASYAARDDAKARSVLWLLALTELRAGRWDAAREYAEQRLEHSEMLADTDANAFIPLALVAAHRGDEAEARAIAERGLELAEASGAALFASWHRGVLGLLEHWGGKPEVAVELYAAAMRAREEAGFREPGSPLFRADYVEALLELGRVEDALAVLEPWEANARRLGREWTLAETTRCRGLVAAARHEPESAQLLLEQAIAMHGAVGDSFGRARAFLALGITRRRMLQKQSAREAIAQALDGFDVLGARSWAEKARAELGRIGGRTRQEGLTAAERRVAALAANGQTNREVAAALFLSERTVESHLTNVYAKLGIRSRTELARLFERTP